MISDNPKNIDNIKYWFDSSDVSTLSLTGIGSVTASVISIKDKINGIVLSSAGSSYPLYYYNNINNCNSIYFQYTNNPSVSPNDRLSSSSITFSSTGSIYSVTKWGATSSGSSASQPYQVAITIAPSSRGLGTWGDFNLSYSTTLTGPNSFNIYPASSLIYSTIGPSLNTLIGTFSGTVNGTSSDINSIGIDIFGSRNNNSTLSKFKYTSIYDAKNEYTNATYSISSLSNKLVIGDYHNSSYNSTNIGFKGYFCELMFFDRYLSDTENNHLFDYLKKKWIG
jgi:hypothetical protein